MTSAVSLKLDKNAFYFIPLGGSEQFGVNLNVYAHNNEYLAVDCGIGFADERHPGIDLLLPDPEFLETRRDMVQGLIVTHAHEDHVGAVAHLWHRFECPIFCSAFTAEILRAKFKDLDGRAPDIEVIEPYDEIEIGSFTVLFVPVSHSIPDTFSLCIRTKLGQVLHSGDWNLDPSPVVGAATSADDFKALVKEQPMLAYIGDSTNAEVDGRSGSESNVEDGLFNEFEKCHGKIIVTTFSSNIGRVLNIYRAAKRAGREVGVIGRSLHRMIAAAHNCGMLSGVDFVSEEDMGFLPDDRLVVIMTGSQGEGRAALSKLARGDLKFFSIKPSDTVIFSARTIPGNEKDINAVKNNLSGAGIKVITPRDTDQIIHVSGHPCRDEIADMYQWIRPQTVIPVHGERMQLEAHAEFAQACQVPNTVIPNNGSVIQLAPGTPKIVDHIETGLLAVDQKRIISADHRSIAARRKLQYTGFIHISLVLNGQGKLLADPKIETEGLIDEDLPQERRIVDSMLNEIEDILDDMSAHDLMDDHFVSEELRIGLRRYGHHVFGVKPKTTVHVLRV